MAIQQPTVTIQQIKRALGERAQDVVERLLGEKPSSKTATELRFFPKGGLVVHVHGPQRGRWSNWGEDGAFGDMLDFIEWRLNCPTGEAVKWAKDFLGLGNGAALPPPPSVKQIQKEAAELEAKLKQRLRTARMIWSKGGAAKGGNGEAYLISRGIQVLPEDVIRHRRLDADAMEKMGFEEALAAGQRYETLIFKATDSAGAITAVQQIVLDGPRKAEVSNKKRTNGSVDGSAVKLGQPTRDLVISEGPETGLSVFQATGVATWIVLGATNLIKVEIPASVKRLWIAVDIEESGAGLASALAAASHWQSQGLEVRLAIPNAGDFNDVLQVEGEEEIRRIFRRAVKAADNSLDPADRPLIVVSNSHDGLAAWRATGNPVRVTLRGIAPLVHLTDHLKNQVKRGIVVLQPGEFLKEGREAYPEDGDYRELKLSTLGLAEVFTHGGDQAVSRLLSLAPGVAQRQIWGLEVLALKPEARVIVTDSRPSCQTARRFYPEAAVIAIKPKTGLETGLDLAPLAGREILLAPAHSTEARAAAQAIAKRLHGQAALTRLEWPLYVARSSGRRVAHRKLPAGYNFASAAADGWTPAFAREILELAQPLGSRAA